MGLRNSIPVSMKGWIAFHVRLNIRGGRYAIACGGRHGAVQHATHMDLVVSCRREGHRLGNSVLPGDAMKSRRAQAARHRTVLAHRSEALWIVVLQHAQRVQRRFDGRRCGIGPPHKVLSDENQEDIQVAYHQMRVGNGLNAGRASRVTHSVPEP